MPFVEDYLFSERNEPLITQPVFTSLEQGMLTGERYMKWYRLYKVNLDLTVEGVVYCGDEWFNHCISPRAFDKFAKELDLEYDDETMGFVCGLFVENYLDGDWTKLAEWLPKAE
jgi:hypothetical protein